MSRRAPRFCVFLSYAKGDEALAKQVAAAFDAQGLICWWDRRMLHQMNKERWTEEIAFQLEQVSAVVLLVTQKLIDKGGESYCREELERAAALGKWVFVILEPDFDDIGRETYWHSYLAGKKPQIDYLHELSDVVDKVGDHVSSRAALALAPLAIDLQGAVAPAAIRMAIQRQAQYLDVPSSLTVALGSAAQMQFLLVPSIVDHTACGHGADDEEARSAPFFVAAHLVSQGVWNGVLGLGPPRTAPNLAQTRITRDEAMSFCGAVKRATGLDVVLPTTRQWTSAARVYMAGHGTRTVRRNVRTGAAPAPAIAVHDARFAANGLVHVLGECWEWTADNLAPGRLGDGPARFGIVRGGSRAVIAEEATIETERWFDVAGRDDHVGFRPIFRIAVGRASAALNSLAG